MPVTPCLGTGTGARTFCPVLSPAVLCWGWGGVGWGLGGGRVGGWTPQEWLLASYLLSCELTTLLLLVTSLMKLVFNFWDS